MPTFSEGELLLNLVESVFFKFGIHYIFVLKEILVVYFSNQVTTRLLFFFIVPVKTKLKIPTSNMSIPA